MKVKAKVSVKPQYRAQLVFGKWEKGESCDKRESESKTASETTISGSTILSRSGKVKVKVSQKSPISMAIQLFSFKI